MALLLNVPFKRNKTRDDRWDPICPDERIVSLLKGGFLRLKPFVPSSLLSRDCQFWVWDDGLQQLPLDFTMPILMWCSLCMAAMNILSAYYNANSCIE